MLNVLGVIPARGGSKSLENKNILEIRGKPVIGYTIEAALESKLLSKLVVSTDCSLISSVVRNNYQVEVIDRPAELAKDDSPIEEALLHAVEHLKSIRNYEADIVVWMHANVPIREKGVIDEVISKLLASEADSCITCFEATEIPEVMKTITNDGLLQPCVENVEGIRRQEFPTRYLADGSVMAMRVGNLFESRGVRKAQVFLGKEIIPFVQSKRMYSIEIDDYEDLELIELYMGKLNAST